MSGLACPGEGLTMLVTGAQASLHVLAPLVSRNPVTQCDTLGLGACSCWLRLSLGGTGKEEVCSLGGEGVPIPVSTRPGSFGDILAP